MQVGGVAFLLAALAVFTPVAQASLGYEPDATTPVIDLPGEQVQQVAIDQGTQGIYAAIPSNSVANREFGYVEQLESTGTLTAASPFSVGGQSLFSGVAVNPLTHGIYAAEFIAQTPVGPIGSSRIDEFSSSGTLGTQFVTDNSGVSPEIGTDSGGRLFYPNATANAVQVFNSAGSLQETIACGACPGGSFDNPSGVALDSEDNLYVVDLENERVLKFTHSGGPYAYASVLQSGKGAAAVAVDTSNDSVFVGDAPSHGSYHIVAYNSSGTQFDDFGAGLLSSSSFGRDAAGQIAANVTTHKLYVGDPGTNSLHVFARVTINPPTATTDAASPVGQVAATLRATVNANFHATTDCHFEYVDDAGFQATGYATATDAPCSSLPDGSKGTLVNAKVNGLSPTTTYHFRIVATNNAGTAEGSSQTFTTMAVTPSTVTTGEASGVAQTVATLTGKVNPHGGSVSNCHFEYGEGISYSTSVPCTTGIEPVDADVAESVKVTGLSPKTSYHYRLSVTSNAGTVLGSGVEVTTLPLAPAVTTGSASGVTQAGATVGGVVNPNGGVSSCHFEYGTTTSYGSNGECATPPGEGEAPVAEQLALSGLDAGTTYHYRLVATNPGGTTTGSDLSFTTQLPSPPVIPQETQPSGPLVVTPKPLKCKKGFQRKRVRGKLRCVKRHRHRHR